MACIRLEITEFEVWVKHYTARKNNEAAMSVDNLKLHDEYTGIHVMNMETSVRYLI